MIVTPGQLAHKAELYHQLGHLTASGIGLIQALELQHRSPPARSMRPFLEQIIHGLQNGQPFHQTLESVPSWMPQFDRSLLEAAETSGRLPAVFQLLAEHYRSQSQLMRTLFGLCAYPFLLIHMAAIIFPINALTNLVLQGQVVSYVLQKILFLAPAYVIVFLVLFLAQGTRAPGVRATIEQFLRGIPVLGLARKHLALARLSAALEALVASGAPLIQGWGLAAKASGSVILKKEVEKMQPRWDHGETPSESLSRSRAFPDVFSNQYASGEVSGRLEETLKWLHQYYRDEGTRGMRSAFLGLAGLIFFGVVLLVVWQVLAFYIGYFKQIQDVIP